MIQIFTYKDYLKYQNILKEKELNKNSCSDNQTEANYFNTENIENIENENNCKNVESKTNENKYNGVREESEKYKLEKVYINNEHDKAFRKILDDKKEAVKFLNKTLKLSKKLLEEDIEKYNSSFVTTELKNQECDIIYKIKNRNIFFLIEHQTKIDYTMPLRILTYENQIIKSAIDQTKIGKNNYKFPKVISIVLYSGKKKWNVKNYIGKVQENLEGYKELEVAKYNIVDVNNYNEVELLQEESLLSKIMLIEKTRNTKDLAYYLDKIADEINEKEDIYSREQRELLITIIELVLNKKLEKEEMKKIIKKLKGGSKEMLAVLEMIEEENKRIFEDGKKKGAKEIAKKLLKNKISLKIIMEATELTEEEIKKIKIS